MLRKHGVIGGLIAQDHWVCFQHYVMDPNIVEKARVAANGEHK
jgi:hypothetical protein